MGYLIGLIGGLVGIVTFFIVIDIIHYRYNKPEWVGFIFAVPIALVSGLLFDILVIAVLAKLLGS